MALFVHHLWGCVSQLVLAAPGRCLSYLVRDGAHYYRDGGAISVVKDTETHELLVRCDCGVEVLGLSAYINIDDVDSHIYLGIGTLYETSPALVGWAEIKDRLKAAWTILRGKRHYFNEVALQDAEIRKVAEYLSAIVSEMDHKQGE